MSEQKKILLIEDDPDHIVALQAALERFGDALQILTASNGREGVKTAKREEPDFITLDIILPEMDGLEALEAIRDIPALKKTPVAMFTNIETDDSLRKARDLGVLDYMVKVDTPMDDLIALIQKTLGL